MISTRSYLKREILINGSQRETRVAILEDDRLVELLVDRPDHRRTVGDIYLGRVEAVLPGIQAAFVDIGQEKSAFLHASDLLEPDEDEEPEDEEAADRGERSEQAEQAEVERRACSRSRRAGAEGRMAQPGPAPGPPWERRRGEREARGEVRQREISPRRALPNIQDILKKGQSLPVQVTKEPISTKGCRVTAQISLPGRFLVYMPYASKVGVSRKIESREQRAKLREMVTKLLPKDSGGVIVRTVAEGVTEEHFQREIDSLLALWKKINRKKTFVRRAPALLQRETSLTRGIIRDLFSAKVDALHVDSKELYNEIEQYLQQIDPDLMSRVHLYTEPTPLFDKFDIESEIRDLFKARVRAADRRLAHHPADRGADQHRRQHRPLHRQEGSREDDPAHQPRGGARDRPADPAARHRRHHRVRLHRHGDAVQPGQGAAGAADPPGPRPGPHQGAGRVRAGPGGDDPPAGAAVALALDDHRLPHLRRQPAGCSRPRWWPGGWSARSSGRGTSTASGSSRCGCIPRWRSTCWRRSPSCSRRCTKLTGLDIELRDDPMMRLDEFRLMSRPAGRDVTELYAVA